MFIAFKLACVARNFVINLRKLIYNLLSRLVILYVKVTYDMMINNLLDIYDKLAICEIDLFSYALYNVLFNEIIIIDMQLILLRIFS